MKNEKLLIIPDLHISQNRIKSINLAIKNIFKKIKNKKFSKIILLGDLTNKVPTIEERIIIAKFLKELNKFTKEIVIIKGTKGHDYVGDLYNFEDLCILTKIKAVEEDFYNDYVFGHYEIKGTKYINGYESKSEIRRDKTKHYVLGHLHSPSCSFEGVDYLGSIYKVSFSEIDDQKRIAIITGEEIEFIPIQTFPMHQVELIGELGKVKVKGLKDIKEKEIDLKIIANTDNQSIGEINRTINKIKEKFDIEYYKEEVKINQIKVNVPKNLNQKELLKNYCKTKKIDYKLILKELKK